MRDVTAEDLRMLRYFYIEKGDHTRYCYWEEIKDSFSEKYAHIIDAFKRLESAQKTCIALMEGLENE